MRGKTQHRISALVVVVALAIQISEGQVHAKDSVYTNRVAPGVIHHHITRSEGPWNIHVLELDLRDQRIQLTSARALDSVKGRETTSSMLRRLENNDVRVLGGVNADFFNMRTGENDLSQIINGEIIYAVQRPRRAQFAISNSGKPLIDLFVFNGKIIYRDTAMAIHAVNNVRDSSSTVLLTHYARGYTTTNAEVAQKITFVQSRRDTMIMVAGDIVAGTDTVDIPKGEFLLRSSRERRFVFSNGDTVRILLQFMPEKEPLHTLVGGLPRIVVEGRNFASSDSLTGLSPRFVDARHPRTGVGFSRDSTMLYLVTVDGRQPSSAGMSLSEFADEMIRLGCYHALNLDGGGSTTMVVNGRVVNSPSDPEGERPVANALVVIERR